jgi:hypothetical protein
MKSNAEKITSATIRAAMARQYGHPTWALLFEVSDATGARHTRFADAVAMSLWPSRGLELHGFEIKVSKYDWRHERDTPNKAETIASYCDRWWLVTCPGVVDNISEIPPAWGWLELAGNGDLLKSGAPNLHQMKPADKLEAKPIDRLFLAALLRRADRMDDAAAEAEILRRDAEREAAFDKRVAEALENRTRHRDDAAKDVAEFEAASGIKIKDGWLHGPEEIGRAVRAVLKTGVDTVYGGLQTQAANLRHAADKIDEGLNELGIEPRLKAEVPRKKQRASAA